ncbi:restriction endonuclease subunit M [Klebsiella pneumoniae subsp. pneumoniae]|uniref:restriction endonuclease subunit S n=1 Tax=Klebsiella pneumoniae TaxID=573 RepID=UPI000B955EBD|nr:restriction endonuclease subunit S [Klebsiella pneumoniae]OYM28005.1 restriction endonuclease subunit M [Klebsiella pneumoniae subsp. pneumoniae]
MSELSYLEKLLDGVEVKWLPLGHIAAIKTGQSVNKNMISKNPGVYPVINSGREPLGFINTWNTDNDPIGITTRGAGVGSVIWQEGKYFRGNLNYSITIDKKSHINIRYMYHALLHMKNDIHELCTFDGIPALNAGSLKKLLIPIPCPDNPEKSLAIQSEIVRILDKFTALTAELTAELNMRKKQYNYYRDQLLSFEEGEVEWKTLGEIGTWHGGGTPSKSRSEFWEDGSIPWISPKDMGRPIVDTSEDYITEEAVEQSSTKLVPANSIAIVVRSSILDKVMPSALIPVPATFNQDMKVVIPHCNISPNYIAHIMRSRGDDILRAAKKSGGSVASIDSKKLFSFRIPVPHLNEQKRIVNILDKFDTLANSITEGLPREIELRQKQYEYYRDLLFSFPKPEATSN